MSATAQAVVRRACPGALRPMASGDGLIVRIRPRAATLTLDEVRALAEAARRFGNGHIDLTRRANLQIRGVTAATLPGLQRAIEDLGLLDPTPEAEAVRNIMVSPLAGLDPTEVLDVRPLARELERMIVTDTALWNLPPKFSFLIDGGGLLSLSRERTDIRLEARRSADGSVIALGIESQDGVRWIEPIRPKHAPRAAAELARSNPLSSTSSRRSWRSHALHGRPEATQASTCSWIGVVHPRGDDGGGFAVGIAAPFGRVEAQALIELAGAAKQIGAAEIRLSPWRIIYVPTTHTQQLLDTARTLGFIVDPADPMLAIDACPGSPACRSAACETRATARAIAHLMPGLEGIRSVHVSGCAKGCARSAPADVVLIGAGDGYALVRRGRADDTPERHIRREDVQRLPQILAARKLEARHG